MKVLKFITITFFSITLFLISILLILYFNIGLLINGDRLKYALDRFEIFKSYSWKVGDINWVNEGFKGKEVEIDFRNFCFDYDKESIKAEGCFTKIYLRAQIHFTYPFLTYNSSFLAYSNELDIQIRQANKETETEGSLIDLKKYYSYVWSQYIPSLDINLKQINVTQLEKKFSFPIQVVKGFESLNVASHPFQLIAMEEGMQLLVEDQTKLPIETHDLELKRTILSLSIREEISLSLFSLIEFLEVSFSSQIPSLINTAEIETLVGTFIENSKLYIFIPEIQKNLTKNFPPPYNGLPAPLNEMEGNLSFKFAFTPLENFHYQGKGEVNIDLKSSHQKLNLSFFPEVKISSKDFSYQDIILNLIFNDVLIELPRLSKRSLPPQFIPDSRFKMSKEENTQNKKGPELDLNIKAEEERSLQLKTDLIDESIRLNFNFNIASNELVDGYIRLLPLNLKILKRPIKVDRFWINFSKEKTPTLNSLIWFNLPEYKIKLVLEGPLSSPRYAFSSEPPLPQSDIYSVLLFGRPLQDMGGDNSAAAQQTSQLIGQGLLSLSVLYILSGTPIEYIGYDPNSKEATAQVGLGDKNSLRVSSGEEGRTTGIRRSLGRGWYLDTSVQTPSGASTQRSQDYGLFLERIISY